MTWLLGSTTVATSLFVFWALQQVHQQSAATTTFSRRVAIWAGCAGSASASVYLGWSEFGANLTPLGIVWGVGLVLAGLTAAVVLGPLSRENPSALVG